jgi:hypothetical protein
MTRRALGVALAAALLAGCATARGILALRQVEFHIDRASGIRLGGVSLDHVSRYSDLSLGDAARIASYAARGQMPFEFDLHVVGENPLENNVTARLVRLQWTLSLNGSETVSGTLDTVYTFPPGQATDVPVPIHLDLARFFRNNARDLFELALGLTGTGGRPTEIALRATPIIDTAIGAITYPGAITIVRRTVGGP